MPVVQDQFHACSALCVGDSFAAQTAQKPLWRNGVSIVALVGALALNAAPAWADGGHGSILANVASGKGGTDGTLEQATGKNGNVALQASSGGMGGGGAVDLTTGNGAAGGAAGAGSIRDGIGQVYGVAGATGAAGLVSTTATAIDNAVVGGAGGAGQAGAANVNTAGGGGGGGVGITSNAALTITATGSATGGTGYGVNNAAAGGGGVGIFSTALVTVAAGGTVTGGAGGGAVGSTAGGGGGMGAILATGGSLVNAGTIIGGKGGGVLVGGGGDGGAGVWVTGGGTVVNAAGGSITGGAGGNGRFKPDVQFNTGDTRGGLGGEGVKGSNITLINAGSISGAMGGTSSGAGAPVAIRANAVTFLGGVNTLELQAGSMITGNVVAFSTADTLRLGGASDASFDVSQIGTAAQYRGFGVYEKTGASTWTLTGTTSEVTSWSLFDGTLSVSSDGNLGAAAGTLTFNGGALQNTASFTSARNITLNAPGGTIETLADLTLTGVISGPGALTKTGASTLTLSGTNSYSGETLIQAGTLALEGTGSLSSSSRVIANGTFDISGVTAAGTDVQRLAGSGAVNLGNKTLTLTSANDLFSGIISGTGGLTVSGGTQTLSGANNYTGATTISGGTLAAGAVNAFSAGSTHTVLNGGLLALNGFDQTIASLNNAGRVSLGSTPGTRLTVVGDYTSNGGVLDIATKLGVDNSPTDLLVITGNSTLGTGTTLVNVINVGGAGGATTGDGIRAIQVDGTSDASTFALAGPVIAGAYRYGLFHNGLTDPADGAWYLRSTGLAPTVPVYENYPQVLLGMVELPTLQQRVGTRYWATLDGTAPTGGTTPSAIWARIEGGHGRIKAASSRSDAHFDNDTSLMQIGLDGQIAANASGIWVGGLTAQYGRASADIYSIHGDGSNITTSYSVGATLTWYGENGLYVDGQAELATLRSNLSAADIGSIGDRIHGSGYALSLEAGRKAALGGGWSLTPQAQLAYASVDFDRFTDRFGADVTLRKGDSLKGRLGIAANYEPGAGTDVYGIGNLTYEFLEGSAVAVSGVDLAIKPQRLGAELGLGGTYGWAEGKYALHGEMLAATSFQGSRSLKGTVGFTMGF